MGGGYKKLKKHISGTRNQKIHLISNKKPEYVGYKNSNLQAISTKNAIKYAKKIKCKYVLKTRTDVRLNSKNFQEYLLNLLKFYKFKNKSKIKSKRKDY